MSSGGHKRRAGLVHKKPAKLDGPRSEINVTPLVDVCLVLLIIFMVITPLLARGKEVPLPRTRNHSEETDKNQPIVAVDKDGRVYFDKELVTRVNPAALAAGQTERQWVLEDGNALKQALEEGWRRALEGRTEGEEPVGQKVFLKADENVPYGMVYPVVMLIHELGVGSIDLGTNELKEQSASP